MKRLLPLVLLLAACTSTPEYPPPQADKAQVVIKVTATPKAGVKAPRTEGQYDKESVEKGRRFTRVNYSEMDCIAVVVKGANPIPRDGIRMAEVEILSDGFATDLVVAEVLFDDSGSQWPTVTFRNERGQALTLYGAAQGNNAATFEVNVPANGKSSCTLTKAGLYDVYCDEDEKLFCQIVATENALASQCESGGELFFDGLAPGAYEVEVYAPRLPVWRMKFEAVAGKRETLYAEVTVNKLPKAK